MSSLFAGFARLIAEFFLTGNHSRTPRQADTRESLPRLLIGSLDPCFQSALLDTLAARSTFVCLMLWLGMT